MLVVFVRHENGNVKPPSEFLIFPTALGENTYLNVIDLKGQRVKLSQDWEAVDSYGFFRYQVDGDKLLVWGIDEKAKQQAIKDGKIKGVIEKDKPAKFIDTTENVARFIAGRATACSPRCHCGWSG